MYFIQYYCMLITGKAATDKLMEEYNRRQLQKLTNNHDFCYFTANLCRLGDWCKRQFFIITVKLLPPGVSNVKKLTCSVRFSRKASIMIKWGITKTYGQPFAIS